MSENPVNPSNATSRFYTNYLKFLENSSIPEKNRRWYIQYIETFIKAQNGNNIKTLSAADITRHFEAIGRQNRVKDWQFAQHIDAIRIMYCELLVPFGYSHCLCVRISTGNSGLTQPDNLK